MNRVLCGVVALVGASVLFSGCSGGAERTELEHVDLVSLLQHMTNVNSFAEAPLGNSILLSSYDKTGGNQDWAVYTSTDANGRITIFDEEGPGYLSRFWIASFYAKNWFFYFDGEDEPRLTLTKADFFGGKFPFIEPLAGISGGGRYSLVPIPFSKSLRIEIEPMNLKSSNRNYYQLNYTKLDVEPSSVTSFTADWTTAESNSVMQVVGALGNKAFDLRVVADRCLDVEGSVALAPGALHEFWMDEGAGLVEAFTVQIKEPGAEGAMSQELLRSLRLQFFWDGLDLPSVNVPLGDFFCNPFYFRSYSSLPLGYIDGSYVCRFPMPYVKGARCVIKNTSAHPVKLKVGAVGNRESSGGLTRKFHAVWRASNTTGRPLPIMEAQGSGHYIGCFLSAVGQDGSWNILEGDEYLRPDDGIQPPQLGTGLEDYFSGAYYYTSLFDLPFHGLIEKGAMRTDQYRLHMLESVAFDDSFDMGIEFGHGNRAQGYMSSLAWWYLDEAVGQPLGSAYSHLLARPADRFELHGLMAQFFQLERAGLYKDAAARIKFFSDRYKEQPWVDWFNVRAVAYKEVDQGFEAVKADYEKWAMSSFAPAAQTAKDALWIQEDESNALMAIHALGKYSVKLDGVEVLKGEGKGELKVVRVNVAPGEHKWVVEAEPTRQGSFFSLCLRTSNGDVTSKGEWTIEDVIPHPNSKTPKRFPGTRVLPNMTVWAFEPNSYVNMQSPPMGVWLWMYSAPAPYVKKVTLSKVWNTDDFQRAYDFKEVERSDTELRAHAVN